MPSKEGRARVKRFFYRLGVRGVRAADAAALLRSNPPIPLGTIVHPWGAVAAIHTRNGERVYFMVDAHDVVALIPAELVEEQFNA